jgi:hypothetical protein
MQGADLPAKIDLDGTYEHLIALLYGVFERDFIESRAQFHGLPVVFDDRKIDSDFEEGFWHVVTIGKGERLIDYKRAKRLPWLRPLIEFGPDPDILCWSEEELDAHRGTMVRKHFIWYELGDYLVILKERPRNYFLATAFHVTGERNHEYYMKKYSGQKKGTGD